MSQERLDPRLEILAQEYYQDIGEAYRQLVQTNKAINQQRGYQVEANGGLYDWGFAGLAEHDPLDGHMTQKPDSFLSLQNSAQRDSEGFVQCLVSLFADKEDLTHSLQAEISFKMNPETDQVKDYEDNDEGIMVDWLDLMRSTNHIHNRKIRR